MSLAITYRDFIQSSLTGARFLDSHHPHLRAEENMWRLWEFGNDGVSYVPAQYRNAHNAGSLMFEIMLTNCTPRGYWAGTDAMQ